MSTTKWHLKNIYSKLNLANRTEAILSMQSRTS
ncbi:MAG: LuxR C-terminal-related transcriptional regulator [Pseudomonas sp.]